MIRSMGQRGFSIVSAIFLLVVLSLLGAFMITLSGTQHFIVMNSVQGARAYHAARSGIEWAIAQVVTAGVDCNTAVNGSSLAFPGYPDFSVTLTCTDGNQSHSEHGTTYFVYHVTATATSTSPAFGQPGYASRRLAMTFTNAP